MHKLVVLSVPGPFSPKPQHTLYASCGTLLSLLQCIMHICNCNFSTVISHICNLISHYLDITSQNCEKKGLQGP